LSVGEILDTAFRIFGATLLKCLPYAALAVIAGQLPAIYDVVTGHGLLQSALGLRQARDPLWWILYLVAIFSSLALPSAIILRQYALATGRPTATAVELATAARRVPGVLLIGILLALAIGATLIPVLVVAFTFGLLRSAVGTAPGIVGLITIGLCVLIAASWVVIRWICSVTVYLLTERGPVASMSHSWHLTSGNFWRLSLVYSVGAVLIIVLYVLSAVVSGVVSLVVGRGDVALITATAAVVVLLLGAIASPFYTALTLAVLGDLSVRKEGTDLAQRISAPAVT
jgi:hypothetical protein